MLEFTFDLEATTTTSSVHEHSVVQVSSWKKRITRRGLLSAVEGNEKFISARYTLPVIASRSLNVTPLVAYWAL